MVLGPPVVPFLPTFWGAFAAEIDYRRKQVGTLILTALLEDLAKGHPQKSVREEIFICGSVLSNLAQAWPAIETRQKGSSWTSEWKPTWHLGKWRPKANTCSLPQLNFEPHPFVVLFATVTSFKVSLIQLGDDQRRSIFVWDDEQWTMLVGYQFCRWFCIDFGKSFYNLWQLSLTDLAVGQNQWYDFWVGAPPILVYLSGHWDVHWGYGILTHGHYLDCPVCELAESLVG